MSADERMSSTTGSQRQRRQTLTIGQFGDVRGSLRCAANLRVASRSCCGSSLRRRSTMEHSCTQPQGGAPARCHGVAPSRHAPERPD